MTMGTSDMAVRRNKRPSLDREIGNISTLARHMPRLTMPLSAMIDSFCERPEIARDAALCNFFDFVKRTYPDEGYAKIQRDHLSPENLEFLRATKSASPEHKYLDLPYWTQSKFKIASLIPLQKYANQDILDLGAGPAHFGLVARHFGCRYTGVDVQLAPRTPANARHLYDDLCNFFGIERTVRMILPFQELAVPGRFKVVTCLMGNFCSYKSTGGGGRRAWDWPEWAFLLDDLVTNQLTPEYHMYFNISRDYLSAHVVEKIQVFAKSFDAERSVFTFDQTLDIDALRRSAQAGP